MNIALQVRRILAKVDEMRAQRAKLAEELRAETHGDDITAKLMAQQQKADGGRDEDALRKVFDAELKKYEPKIKVSNTWCSCKAGKQWFDLHYVHLHHHYYDACTVYNVNEMLERESTRRTICRIKNLC